MNNAQLVPPERNDLPNLSRLTRPVRGAKGDELSGPSRYELLVKVGSGGMASVYVGRVSGSAGFSRLVAVKRAHSFVLNDPAGERMMSTEARLSSKLNHANVVAVQDVERTDGELLLIMDYIEGASLADLIEAGVAAGRPMPARIAVRIVLDACAGLVAAHELEAEDGRRLGFLHRDVSPQNILVGIDGTARLSDFGLAKALASSGVASATNCALKGKLAYLAPEIIDHAVFSVKSDLFAMGVVTWEALARRRLFRGASDADTIRRLGLVAPPLLSRVVPELGGHLDDVIQRALEKDAARRFGTVRAFASALEEAARRADLIATSAEVGAYVSDVVGAELHRRRERIRGLEQNAGKGDLGAPLPISVPRCEEPSLELSARDLLPIDIMPAKAAAPPRPAARRWGSGAALVAVLCGSALATGVFFAKPWVPGAGDRVASLWSKAGTAMAAAPKRVEAPLVIAVTAPPPAKSTAKVEEKKPAALQISALPDVESATKPSVIKASELPDTEVAGKPVVINVSSLPDKESESRPSVINVSDLPDKNSEGRPAVINVSSLPDR